MPRCKGCGRGHLGTCAYKSHPDYNRTDFPWEKSPKGLEYAKRGIHKLPLDPPFLDGSDQTWTKPPRKGAKGILYNKLNSIYETSDDIPVIDAKIRAPNGESRQIRAHLQNTF